MSCLRRAGSFGVSPSRRGSRSLALLPSYSFSQTFNRSIPCSFGGWITSSTSSTTSPRPPPTAPHRHARPRGNFGEMGENLASPQEVSCYLCAHHLFVDEADLARSQQRHDVDLAQVARVCNAEISTSDSLSACHINHLPAEILYRILELMLLGAYRYSDLATLFLRRTSLVARAWYAPSQMLLGKLLRVQTDTQAARREEYLVKLAEPVRLEHLSFGGDAEHLKMLTRHVSKATSIEIGGGNRYFGKAAPLPVALVAPLLAGRPPLPRSPPHP